MDIDLIRKLASVEHGRRLMESLSDPPVVPAVTNVLLHKAAECDVRFLKIASWMRTGDTLEAYEALTGGNATGVESSETPTDKEQA